MQFYALDLRILRLQGLVSQARLLVKLSWHCLLLEPSPLGWHASTIGSRINSVWLEWSQISLRDEAQCGRCQHFLTKLASALKPNLGMSPLFVLNIVPHSSSDLRGTYFPSISSKFLLSKHQIEGFNNIIPQTFGIITRSG